MIFNALIERDPDSEVLVGSVPEVRSAYTQGATVDEVLERLTEVLQMLAEEGLHRLEELWHREDIELKRAYCSTRARATRARPARQRRQREPDGHS